MAQIYRITHINNLPFILQQGIYCPNSPVKDPAFTPIGFPSLINYRHDREVPLGPGGTLADYVPFYFTVKSPMLFVIAKGNDPEVLTTPQHDIVYLVSSTEQLLNNNCRYVFTDRHAQLDYTRFFNQNETTDQLNWEVLKSAQWGRQFGAERKEIKQAECLVYQQVPVGAILGIGCQQQSALNLVNDSLLKTGLKIPAKIKQDWYF